MVDFATVVKGSFRKFRLRAEVALLENDIGNRQRDFGVELYDLIESQRRNNEAEIDRTLRERNVKPEDEKDAREAVGNFLKVFRAVENEIEEPLERCRKDVAGMGESVPGFPPLFVRRRKGDFGIEVWPIASGPKWLHESLERDLKKALESESETEERRDENGGGGGGLVAGALNAVVRGTVTTVAKAIGKLSPEERAVEACVQTAKTDVAGLEETRREKLSEIEALVASHQTLECCA